MIDSKKNGVSGASAQSGRELGRDAKLLDGKSGDSWPRNQLVK